MKHIYGAIIVIFVAISPSLRADETARPNSPPPVTGQSAAPYSYYTPPPYLPPQPPAYQPRPFQTDPAFTLLDILVYRPIGLAVTIAGAGLVVGASPLIALASIPKPHDAFPQAFDILVTNPAAYTFVRPLGDRTLPFPYLPRY
jgi:hypothetical protein